MVSVYSSEDGTTVKNVNSTKEVRKEWKFPVKSDKVVVTTQPISQKSEEFPMVEQLIAIFCDIDEFCIEYEKYLKTHLLQADETQKVSTENVNGNELYNDNSGVFPFVEPQIFQVVLQRFYLRRPSCAGFLRKTRIIQSFCRVNAESCCSINIIPHET